MIFEFRFLSLLFLASTSFSCAAENLTYATVPDVGNSEKNSPASIVESRSCFTGPFESYESWISGFAESNSEFDRKRFEKRIPKQYFERAKLELNCQRFLYDVDGVTVEGYLVHPKSFRGRLPVVIYNRGGNGSHARIKFGSLFSHVFPLAESGNFVIASQYRGSGFRRKGLDTGEDEFGGKDVDDVLALFDLIDGSPVADASRIGMFGWSRGAIMSFLVASRTDRVAAIAVGGAPTNILKEVAVRPEMERVFEARIPNYAADREAALKSRSVMFWAEKLPRSTPILILHGQLDANVTVNSALDLAAELQLREIPYRLVIYENGTHALFEYKQPVNTELLNWFEEKLD